MRRKALRSAGRGEGRLFSFPFLYSTPIPFSLCLIIHSLDNVGGKCHNMNCMLTTTINSYTSNIMAGVLEFIGSHLLFFIFSCTIIIFSFHHFSLFFLFFFFLLPHLAAGTKRKRKTAIYTSISQCVCVDKREGRELFVFVDRQMYIGQTSKVIVSQRTASQYPGT
ncbi:hypothetical protein M441DRAFT_251554 [Trichoderma asperellum CBS 433.97]|uniref:Uncharacterized protein n=1 Tax=Trichoderma asperellum (strain ATCC 204424 / CBS 433.97 / NBRC 101777) TaxID=1042311 RepID=A0A2T3Z0S9_TRIA4|nr:hypothetical protein M441DRAFT_251554 [Trichoderma asperellum CBS 433.97]PTB38397.1 hypothetical protein M441DRAFT_251554 [Trichoderma asperellum CBS 433.97]